MHPLAATLLWLFACWNQMPKPIDNERSRTEDDSSPRSAKSRGKYLGFWTKDQSLYEQVQADAEQSGLTVSDYLRELTSGAPVPRKYRPSNDNRVQVGKFVAELNKLGSNVNQIAKQANRAALTGQWETMPTAETVISCCSDILQHLEQIQADLQQAIGKK